MCRRRLLLSSASILAIGEPVFWKELILLHTAFLLLQIQLAGICFGISALLHDGSLQFGYIAPGMCFLLAGILLAFVAYRRKDLR